MNIKKGFLSGALLLALSLSTFSSAFAQVDVEKTVKDKHISVAICSMDSNLTFEDFSKDFKKNISKDDLKKAKKLFKIATESEEEAQKIWDKFYSLGLFDEKIDEYDFNIEVDEEPFTFESFSKELKKDIEKDVLKKAEKLFNKAIKLEEENKDEEAEKVWDEFYSLGLFDDEIVTGDVEIDEKPITFESFAKEFKKDIKKDVIKKAEKLFDKAIKLEKENKGEEAEKVWNEFYSLGLFDDEIIAGDVNIDEEPFTFESLTKDFKKDIKKDVIKKAEKLFDKAIKLEGENKDEEAEKVWDEFYSLGLFGDEILEGDINVEIEEEPFTFESFTKEFKKDIKKDVLKEAETLFNKVKKLDEKAIKAWNELYNMDIYKTVDCK